MRTETKLIHPKSIPEIRTGSLVFPVITSTIFAMTDPSSNNGFQYSRINNPTREHLEETLANLHASKFGLAFSSGSAAIAAVLLLLASNDEIIIHNQAYEGTIRMLDQLQQSFKIKIIFADLRRTENLHTFITKKTKMILFETPTNPLLSIISIKKIAKIAHAASIPVVVDNTMASFMLQRPVEHGADIVIESLSKVINGHSDVIGGFVGTNNQHIHQKLRKNQHTFGAILSPTDAGMVLRGMKTLQIRLQKQQHNAKKIVVFLKKHPLIEKVFFPGVGESTSIAKQQMNGTGTVISFVLDKEINNNNFLKKLHIIFIGHSFGGIESVIQHPTSMMDLSSLQDSTDITPQLCRLSVGIENHEDIIMDLKNALER